LLKRLLNLGLGVYIGGIFFGAVCYADDVLLIASTRSAMQRMIYELERFVEESNIVLALMRFQQSLKVNVYSSLEKAQSCQSRHRYSFVDVAYHMLVKLTIWVIPLQRKGQWIQIL